MVSRIVLGVSFLSLALLSTARADLLINGGLEKDPSTPLDQFGMVTATPSSNSTALPGWTITSGSVDLVPGGYWQAAEGAYSVDLVGTPGLGGISQVVATDASASYTLIFDYSINPQNGWLGESGTTKRLLVEALAADGSTLLASKIYSLTAGTRTTSDMQWLSDTLDFTATGASSTIRLSALSPLNLPDGATDATIRTGPVVDNLILLPGGGVTTFSTPEPASISLLGLSAAALLLRRRSARC